MRRTAALSLALSLSWMGLAIVPTPSDTKTRELNERGPITRHLLKHYTASAQTEDRVTWTEPYADAVEAQTNWVLQDRPLDRVLTRLEMAQWLTEFFGYRSQPSQAMTISDMDPSSPDYATAQAVLQEGVMQAFEGNQFRPEGDLTKLEAIAILVRALQLSALSDAEVDRWLSLYKDSDALPEVGGQFVALAGQAGLIVNYPEPTQLNPNLILNRGEGIVLLHQSLLSKKLVRPLNPPIAQVAPEVLPKPEITAIRVLPESGRVAPGEPLTVEVEGTPNANGAVLIAGSIQQPLLEVDPGLYRAVYTPTTRDAISNPSVAVLLDLNGERTRSQRQLPELALGNAPAPTAPPPIASRPSLPAQPSTLNPPPPPAASAPPSFTGIYIGPQRDLRVGDIFTVGLQGDPGGVAWFTLGSIAQEQPMPEIRPGVYEGTYAISTADYAQQPNLKVIFSKNSQGAFHEEVFPFSINRAAAAAPVPPTAPSTSSDPAPADAPVSPPMGAQPLIFSSSSNASNRELRPNDVLEVRMRGEYKARAAFRIPNITTEIPMTEVAPGMYEGRVTIENNTPVVRNGYLQVLLEKNGLVTTRLIPEPININPTPAS
ncbi:MAG: S-layer homology domain-containing protein [Synechococcus sp.]